MVLIMACSFTFVENFAFMSSGDSQFLFTTELPKVISGKKIETRKVSDFSIINLSISADVFITQGNKTSIEVEADEKALENLITRVSGDELTIKWKDNDYYNGDVIFRITMKDIEELNIAGSGNIYANSKIRCEDIELNIAGSGDILLKDLSAEEIESEIAGSGNIKLGGQDIVASHEINIAGSGDVSAKKLKTEKAFVNIAGSGNCYVNVLKSLNVNIVGSGDVYYFGSPKISSNIIGSGDLEKL